MKPENLTPYRSFTFPTLDQFGNFYETCVVRGTFDIEADGILTPAEVQIPPQLFDSYYGDPKTSSLRTEHDRIPQKIRGEAYFVDPVSRAPTGKPQPEWYVNVTIGSINRKFLVRGPSYCRKSIGGGLRLTNPEPCAEVPLRFEYAFGGTSAEDIRLYHSENPAGRGYHWDVSSIDSPGPQLFNGEHELRKTVGLTPLNRAWSPRRELAGTADENWRKKKWPLYPDDFNPEYYQQAPEQLRLPKGYFSGDEMVHIVGIGRRKEYIFSLPEPRPVSLVVTDSVGEHYYADLKIDTLIFDLEKEQISLVWRTSFSLPDNPKEASLLIVDNKDSPENNRNER